MTRGGLLLCALLALPAAPARADRPDIRAVRSWAYQLQKVDIEKLAASDYDLLVIDQDDEDGEPWTKDEIERLRRSGPGGRRIVLAYISIGEAESYRSYWDEVRRGSKLPEWIGKVNPHWRENYPVKYWHPEWQRVLLAPGGYVDRLLAQGFDGLYLDRLDVYEVWGTGRRGLPTEAEARRRMVELVRAIAARARAQRAGALIVPQNAPELVAEPGYLELVDALALEDVFHTYDGRCRKPSAALPALEAAMIARDRGLPVLAVDYLPRCQMWSEFEELAGRHGLVAYAAPSRWLNRLPGPCKRQPKRTCAR